MSTTTAMVDFRVSDMLETARVVLAHNPAARGKFANANALAEYMVTFAYLHLRQYPTYGGTFGFYVTSFHVGGDKNTPLRAHASVAPSLFL
jgi:hypothetical protein